MIKFLVLVNKQGQTRLARYYEDLVDVTGEERAVQEADIVRKCLMRGEQQCSFFEYRGYKIAYRRYASLFFVVGADEDENELAVLELIHALVETLDRHFDNVCELDIMSQVSPFSRPRRAPVSALEVFKKYLKPQIVHRGSGVVGAPFSDSTGAPACAYARAPPQPCQSAL
eukprot:Tamp_08126.p4 GENE.Tamp_08126~~Tamp_08126.p4  ORF type:complete len:171 (-),score=37.48 Tamp_08126:1746-2258(-)